MGSGLDLLNANFKEQHLDGVNLLVFGLFLVQRRRYPLLLRNVKSVFMHAIQVSPDKLCLEYCVLLPLRFEDVD